MKQPFEQQLERSSALAKTARAGCARDCVEQPSASRRPSVGLIGGLKISRAATVWACVCDKNYVCEKVLTASDLRGVGDRTQNAEEIPSGGNCLGVPAYRDGVD